MSPRTCAPSPNIPSPSCAPEQKPSVISARRWSIWIPRACRWSCMDRIDFPTSTRDSGFPAPRRIETPQQAAAIYAAARALGRRTALLIANPIPAAEALREIDVEDAVRRAMERASAAGVRAGDLTPFLLTALADLTGGRSLRANLALLRANAALAGAVAVAVSRPQTA